MAKNKKGSKALRSTRDNRQRKKPTDGRAWTANILRELTNNKESQDEETTKTEGVDTNE